MVNRNFTPFPTLKTERLTLRQLLVDDQQDVFALRSDAEVNKYLGRAPSQTVDEAINFINMIDENVKNNNAIYWAISLTSTTKFVGTICLYNFSIEKNSCEIGYELLTKFQGQGIMKEAIEVVINYAFQTLKVHKIVAFTHNENLNSTKLLTKVNFVKSKETDTQNPNFSIFTLTLSQTSPVSP
ncbi:GNAT family N-acetyltransferase [Pedobacter sp. Du54]|uniref:GNAT family N-acetyltransferase n=1 Tax=Pedobacter anseongensis TaxID=3133439 RepID=UPI00309C8C5C